MFVIMSTPRVEPLYAAEVLGWWGRVPFLFHSAIFSGALVSSNALNAALLAMKPMYGLSTT
jgi:hypothetical protein